MTGPFYVVVAANDKPHPRWGMDEHGAMVHETYLKFATLDQALARASQLEAAGNGAHRIARLVFEDHPAFNEA